MFVFFDFVLLFWCGFGKVLGCEFEVFLCVVFFDLVEVEVMGYCFVGLCWW